MKKLLLLAAILAIGTTAFGAAISDGESSNTFDGIYGNTSAANNMSIIPKGPANKFKDFDITTGDKTQHFPGGVNLFRKNGKGWKDHAKTKVTVDVFTPIKIESEVDYLNAEIVKGDKIAFGDIGFTVMGQPGIDVEVKFVFKGALFDDFKGRVTAKRLASNDYEIVGLSGADEKLVMPIIPLYTNGKRIYEVDLYLNSKGVQPGTYEGRVIAHAKYQ